MITEGDFTSLVDELWKNQFPIKHTEQGNTVMRKTYRLWTSGAVSKAVGTGSIATTYQGPVDVTGETDGEVGAGVQGWA